MRHAFILAVLISTLATTTHAAFLLSSDHPSCKLPIEVEQTCDYGMDFLRAEDGRCGCVGWGEYYTPALCARFEVRCNENRGESFASLYRFEKQNTVLVKEKAGCGCFAEYDEFPRE